MKRNLAFLLVCVLIVSFVQNISYATETKTYTWIATAQGGAGAIGTEYTDGSFLIEAEEFDTFLDNNRTNAYTASELASKTPSTENVTLRGQFLGYWSSSNKDASCSTKVWAGTYARAVNAKWDNAKDAATYTFTATPGTYIMTLRAKAVTNPTVTINGTAVTFPTSTATTWADVSAASNITLSSSNTLIIKGGNSTVVDYILFTPVSEEVKELQIYVNDKEVDTLSSGSVKVKLNHDELENNATIVASIYESGRLFAVKTQTAEASGTELNFGTLTFEDGKEYTVKCMKLGSTSTLRLATTADGTISTPTPTPTPTQTPTPTPELYVSTTGNDTNAGTSEAPLKTISKAIELAEEKKGTSSEYVIYLNSGTYYLDSTLALTSADNNITFRGPEDGSAVISGAKAISSWTADENGVYKANVDVTDVRELYVNGNIATRARTDGLASTGGRIKAVDAIQAGIIVDDSTLPAGFLTDPSGAELVFDYLWSRHRLLISGTQAYADGKTTLTMAYNPYGRFYLNDFTQDSKCIIPGSTYGYCTTRQYFYAEGHRALLDQPGEFYYDKDAKLIYYIPRTGETMSTAAAYIGYLEGMVTVTGASDIKFENLAFEGGTFMLPSTYSYVSDQGGMYMDPTDSGNKYGDQILGQIFVGSQDSTTKTTNITFDNIKMRNMTGYGIDLGFGATNCNIINSSFNDMGAGAVAVGKVLNCNYSETDVTKLKNANIATGNTISNCTMRNIAKVYSDCPAIQVFHAVDTTITHNDIEDCAYSGIALGWGWHAVKLSNDINSGGHVVAYNRIVNTVNVVEDGAPIYTLGNFVGGVDIHHNYLSRSYDGYNAISPTTGSIMGDTAKLGYHGGIYLDEGTTNVDISYNVVEYCYQWLNCRYYAANENITASNNYSDVAKIRTEITGNNGFATGVCDIQNHTQVSDRNWPSAAQAIINTAGVEQ